MAFSWTTFTKRIPVNASVADVYRCWATGAGMESWFLRSCRYTTEAGEPLDAQAMVQAGNHFTWLWHGWPDDTNEKGAILSANGTDTLSFTFGQEGAEGMICTVRIYPEAGAAICELVQENIPVDERGKSYYFVGCNTGWTFYMANLKSILEGGVDLRNKNPDIKNVLNA